MKTLLAAAFAALFALLYFNPVQSDPGVEVPWVVDCDDYSSYNGFRDEFGRCIPGVLTEESWRSKLPSTYYGLGDTYAPGVMERVCNGRCKNYLDGIAVMTCNDIGKTAWLKRPGHRWEGPFLIIDCSQKRHLYYNIVEVGLVVEWGYSTSERWNTKVVNGIAVHIGGKPGPNTGRGVYLASWWIENGMEFEIVEIQTEPLYTRREDISVFFLKGEKANEALPEISLVACRIRHRDSILPHCREWQ